MTDENKEAAAHPIHGMNADQAKAYVAEQALEDLAPIQAAEQANPKNPGGRVSVLKAIQERQAKLTAPPTPPAQNDEAQGEDQGDSGDIEIVPEAAGTNHEKAISLLLNACEKYGVHPGLDRRPRELQAWKFHAGSRVDGVPDAVVIVTAGGQKLKEFADPNYPMDPNTDEKLHQIFNAYKVDKVTKLPVPVDLPKNLTLPDAAVTGIVTSIKHRYVGGYLRRGGKVTAKTA